MARGGVMSAIVRGRRGLAEELMVGLARHANPLAEGWTPTECRHSAEEVRESAAAYRIERRAG